MTSYTTHAHMDYAVDTRLLAISKCETATVERRIFFPFLITPIYYASCCQLFMSFDNKQVPPFYKRHMAAERFIEMPRFKYRNGERLHSELCIVLDE